MPPTKTAALETRIDALEKSLGELQGAIRRLSDQNNNNVAMISKLSEDMSNLGIDLLRVKNQAGKVTKYDTGITRYE